MRTLKILVPLLALWLAACSKLSAPVAGDYRAYVELRGGQVPFVLRVGNEGGVTRLWRIQDGEPVAATEVRIQDGTLQAQLAQGAGALRVSIGRKTLKGELRITDPQGKLQVLPFAADLGQTYRFVEHSSTDNADVSGYWQLEAISPNHFSAPVTLQLSQTHDGIEGQLLPSDPSMGQSVHLSGQVQGDEVYLGSVDQGRALLFKGKVNAQGELQGELWINLSSAQTAFARRMNDTPAATEEVLREVALPWAIPSRNVESTDNRSGM
jgi:hypothetical protein